MSRLSDKPNEPMGTCDYPGGKIPHTERRCLSPADWKPLPTAPVDAPPSDTSLLCADCKHPKNDSRFHLEAPGDNWGAALHHFVPAAPAQEDLERARKLVYEMGICSTSGHMARMIAKEYAADCAFRRAAQAERQVVGAGKFTVTFRPYPAGAGSRVHDESWTIEGNSLRDALDKFYCKPEFNSEWRVVDVALPAERVSAEELAKLIAKWRDGISKCCPSVLEPGPKPSREYADVHQGCARQARDADEVEAILRPTHTPESGQ